MSFTITGNLINNKQNNRTIENLRFLSLEKHQFTSVHVAYEKVVEDHFFKIFFV